MKALIEITTPESAHGRASKGRTTILAALLSLLCLTGTAAKAEDAPRSLPTAIEAPAGSKFAPAANTALSTAPEAMPWG